MTPAYDAVVVGAGPNGLVAANRLLDAGWDVLVLEAQPRVGGAVRSDRGLHPDFVHDTMSAFYPLAAASPTIRSFALEQHGLRWAHAPAVLGHPLPDGDWALLHRDRDLTAGWFAERHPADAETWLDLCRAWDRIGDAVVAALLSPFPPVRAGLQAARRIPGPGGLDILRVLLGSATTLARRFRDPGPGLLLAGNAGHADLPLHSLGSGMFAMMLTMLGQTVGYPVPEGGAGRLTEALADRLRAGGATVLCEREVTEVLVAGGRAVGVRTHDGERYAARHAVLADVAAPHLFGGLVAAEHLPRGVVWGMEHHFRMDPGTIKVDWALSGPVPWAQSPAYLPGTVHVAASLEEMSHALEQVADGVVPAHPFLLTGQMTATDPTRSPAGTESMWAYTHVPQPSGRVRDDGDGSISGTWDRDDCERFADRMQERLERLAPGFGSRVVARRVLGPVELEALDANLIGGAVNGGTARVRQQLFLRPVPRLLGRPETGVPGLYLASASAHPGGGVHGAPGDNAARAALRHASGHRATSSA